MVHYLLLLPFLFHPVEFQLIYHEPTEIEYNKTISAITNGSLIPHRYEMIKDNDTKYFTVRINFTTVRSRCSPTISLLCNRNSSMQVLVLPRTQTFGDFSTEYLHLQDTLCEVEKHNATFEDYHGKVCISISSAVPAQYTFSVHKSYHDFLEPTRPYQGLISPSEPRFFKFYFLKGVDMINVLVTSKTDICGRLTIQKANCPVFDNEGQVVLNDNYAHQTISMKGYLTITREQFGGKLHIILSALPDDDLCNTKPYYPGIEFQNSNRVKDYEILITVAENNVFSIYVVLALFAVTTMVIMVGGWYVNDGGNNDENRPEQDNPFWEMSLSQCCVFIPMALIIVMAKYSNTGFPSDTDTCNINFMCSVNFFGLIAANNVISAFSIAVVGVVNFILSWSWNWAENFMINVYIILTGVLWATTNTCPQSDTFLLYVFAMIMTMLQGKFLQFGIRNEMKLWHQNYIGCYTMTTMLILIGDSVTDTKFAYVVGRIAVVINASVFTLYFLYRYWNELAPIEEHNVIRTERLSAIATEIAGELVLDEEDLPLIPSEDTLRRREAEQRAGILRERAPTSDSGEISTSENFRRETSITDYMKKYIFINERSHETAISSDRLLQSVYSILSLLLVIEWTIVIPFFFPYYNSTKVMLRLMQSDFLLYFLYYCVNKWKYETNFCKLKKFAVFSTCFFLAVTFWGLISQYKLPAFVPYSPAESRNLNQECLISNLTGTDWYDILHYCTAGICFLFPAMMKFIDKNLAEYEVVKVF